MKTSLIIATYNWKEALALVLKSVLGQSRLPDEIIVADDGSPDGTGELVRNFAARSVIPVSHCWQEDMGFRAARSRNNGIARAQGDYIILVDGDIVLEKHFVEDHIDCAEPEFFIQGSRALLGRKKTAAMLKRGLVDVRITDRGVGNRKNCLRSKVASGLFSGSTENYAGLKTCNFSFFRKDAVAINGFNEDFVGWGREDSEFAARLMHSGTRRRNLRFRALAYHLYHPELEREALPKNDAILANTIKNRLTRCENGLNLHATP